MTQYWAIPLDTNVGFDCRSSLGEEPDDICLWRLRVRRLWQKIKSDVRAGHRIRILERRQVQTVWRGFDQDQCRVRWYASEAKGSDERKENKYEESHNREKKLRMTDIAVIVSWG